MSLGAKLRHALDALQGSEPSSRPALCADLGIDVDERLPVVVGLQDVPLDASRSWADHRRQFETRVDSALSRARNVCGEEPLLLVAANAMAVRLSRQEIADFERHDLVEDIELDPEMSMACMDDVPEEIGLPLFRARHPTVTGRGVRVAVLDSGVDSTHPFLKVARSIATSPEGPDPPGVHGTHCAGIIASSDDNFRGVAPGVTLFDVKCLTSVCKRSRPSIVEAAVDEALALEAHVLSMSVGANPLPKPDGAGWRCAAGRCRMCRAVDRATDAGAVVVVAAGNGHEDAAKLRVQGREREFDTEIYCPGHARTAITVGSLTKATPEVKEPEARVERERPPGPPRATLASDSSQGPTAYGTVKPDLCAPGVNITSTVPVQDAGTQDRALMFGTETGTSHAAPVVAGAAALLIQGYIERRTPWTPAMIKDDLVRLAADLGLKPNEAGHGALRLPDDAIVA